MFKQYRLIIHGHPVVLKNSKKIVRRGKRLGIDESDAAKEYRTKALKQLEKQWALRPRITGPISLRIRTHGAWKRSGRGFPDASNLYQFPEDLLEQAGVIENDRDVEHHDGSRRICMCDDCTRRGIYLAGPKRGQRKPDCGAVKSCSLEFIDITITIL